MLNENFTTSDGDIFEGFEDGEFNVLLHVMNRKGNFRHGFSRQVANRFPDVVEVDADTVSSETGEPVKGGISVSHVSDGKSTMKRPKIIVNLYCIRNNRDETGSLISTKQLAKGLKEINSFLHKSSKVGFIKMGTGISGGDWDEISKVLNDSGLKGVFYGNE